MEYNRSRQGRALPPDIYLGLRFADANGQPPTPNLHQGVGGFFLSYLNTCWLFESFLEYILYILKLYSSALCYFDKVWSVLFFNEATSILISCYKGKDL